VDLVYCRALYFQEEKKIPRPGAVDPRDSHRSACAYRDPVCNERVPTGLYRKHTGDFIIPSASFGFNNKNEALLGTELARRLGVKSGDEINLFSIPSLFNASNGDGLQNFIVTGIFRTGFYEYDGPVLGLKLKNRFHDQQALELGRKTLVNNPVFTGAAFSSWRDYNRSFFGALRTEKLFMFILVGLIFIVVALNIYQAQRRSVLEHREENTPCSLFLYWTARSSAFPEPRPACV